MNHPMDPSIASEAQPFLGNVDADVELGQFDQQHDVHPRRAIRSEKSNGRLNNTSSNSIWKRIITTTMGSIKLDVKRTGRSGLTGSSQARSNATTHTKPRLTRLLTVPLMFL